MNKIFNKNDIVLYVIDCNYCEKYILLLMCNN